MNLDHLLPIEGEGAGLVEHHGIDGGKPLQRTAVLDQHAPLCCRAQAVEQRDQPQGNLS